MPLDLHIKKEACLTRIQRNNLANNSNKDLWSILNKVSVTGMALHRTEFMPQDETFTGNSKLLKRYIVLAITRTSKSSNSLVQDGSKIEKKLNRHKRIFRMIKTTRYVSFYIPR